MTGRSCWTISDPCVLRGSLLGVTVVPKDKPHIINSRAAPWLRPRVMRVALLQPYVGLSRSQIYALSKAGEFPRPIRLTNCTSAWITREVDDWLDRRIAAQRQVPVLDHDPAMVEAER